MRKIVLAVAMALAFPAAFAQSGPTQSGVELYGIVDIGLESVDNGPKADATKVTSGISTGSRWGIRGNEDLGNGYRAIFTLENRFEADTGSMTNRGPTFFCGTTCPGVTIADPLKSALAQLALTNPTLAAQQSAALIGGMSAVNTQLLQAVSTVNSVGAIFDRQAYVGLVTPVGAILLGRQYTPNYEVLVKFNSFADSFAGNMGQVSTINLRANNAIQYRAELKGFTLSAMYGFGGAEGKRDERVTPPEHGDDFYGFNLQYNTPQFGVAAGYGQNRTVTYAAPNENRKGLETYSVGGRAAVGPVTVFAHFLKAKNDNPVIRPEDIQGLVYTAGTNLPNVLPGIVSSLYINAFDVDSLRGLAGPTDMKVYHLGLQWNVGNGQLLASISRSKDTARSVWATGDAEVDVFGLAYLYDLSKRSQLYASAALANNKDQARAALGAACCRGGWTTSPGEDSRVLQVGMRHSF